jgi:anti-sigma regulatory factor (Ser/Thr protein kinase)
VRDDASRHAPESLWVRLPLDARAPGAARLVAAVFLRDRIAAVELDDAQLILTELVTNSLRHSGAFGAAVVVRFELTGASVRFEVEDPGHGGAIAPRPPDHGGGGGFGLHLVQALSERWGLERRAAGGTRVWAQLARHR